MVTYNIIFLRVKILVLQVKGPNGETVPHQVSLVWKEADSIMPNKYLLSFVANIPSLGLSRYQIKVDSVAGKEALATVTAYNTQNSYSKYKNNCCLLFLLPYFEMYF